MAAAADEQLAEEDHTDQAQTVVSAAEHMAKGRGLLAVAWLRVVVAVVASAGHLVEMQGSGRTDW